MARSGFDAQFDVVVAGAGSAGCVVAARLTESLADLILLAPPADQAKLFADVLANLGQAYLEKTGAIESTPRH